MVNHSVTYQIVDSMNGFQQPDTVAEGVWASKRGELSNPGKKIVFIDVGEVRSSSYHVSYRDAKWLDMPPVRHNGGMTFVFADGGSGYWKWKGKGTVNAGKKRTPDYTPVSTEDREDLRDMRIAVWGEIP
jgi:prepilin-type processing-associated H-X9-DG protein